MFKFIVVISVLVIHGSAFADGLSLTCDAQQLAVQGRQGTVTVTATDASGTGLTVQFQGDASALLANSTVCGSVTPAAAPCSVQPQGASSLTTSYYVSCVNPADGQDTTAGQHLTAYAVLNLDAAHTHGYFYCQQNATQPSTIEDLQLSNCH